jgi:hypothetical protein
MNAKSDAQDFRRLFYLLKIKVMIKEEKFTTELGFSFELSIGDNTGRLLFDTEHDTLQFTREEVAELIYILQLYYERMD